MELTGSRKHWTKEDWAQHQREYQRKWRERNRQHVNQLAREWSKKNLARRREIQKDFYWRHRAEQRERYRNYWNNGGKRVHQNAMLKRKYGISLQEKEALLLKQEGCCAICDKPLLKPHVDHDHKTGRVRGLLCTACNHALGTFKDSVKILRAAIAYLEGA